LRITARQSAGVPASLAKASVVERGKSGEAADCMVCTPAPGAKEYTGGLGFKLPFGALYSTNITPDKETGIGNYSDQDFLNAVQRGKRTTAHGLYPAMPYASYTYMSDADALAIKAYLSACHRCAPATPANTLTFRSTSAGHDVLVGAFNRTRATRRIPRRARMECGAYLVEALAHCGECHTRATSPLR